MNPRKPIRKVSKKRAVQLRDYAKLREQFLKAHPYCQVFIGTHGLDEADVIQKNGAATVNGVSWAQVPFATQVHHMNGRYGTMLNKTEFWLAVSDAAHKELHHNPALAIDRGFTLIR